MFRIRNQAFWIVAVVVVLPVAVAAGDDPLFALEKKQQALFERVAPSVVFISNPHGLGSGFFVSRNGLVLTNQHVVGKGNLVDVVLHDGTRLQGTVVERAPEKLDLALVQVEAAKAPVLPVGGMFDLLVGSWVASVGHNRGGIWTFNTGMVSNIYPAGSERPVFQTQIPLNPGSSGGPIVDRLGRVVGVVTAGLVDSNSINFGIRMDVAIRSLRKLADISDVLTITAPKGVAVFVDGKMAGTGPRVVIPADPGTHEIFAVIGGKMKKIKIRYPERRLVELK
jgi:S1-C subfamily serine protease